MIQVPVPNFSQYSHFRSETFAAEQADLVLKMQYSDTRPFGQNVHASKFGSESNVSYNMSPVNSDPPTNTSSSDHTHVIRPVNNSLHDSITNCRRMQYWVIMFSTQLPDSLRDPTVESERVNVLARDIKTHLIAVGHYRHKRIRGVTFHRIAHYTNRHLLNFLLKCSRLTYAVMPLSPQQRANVPQSL